MSGATILLTETVSLDLMGRKRELEDMRRAHNEGTKTYGRCLAGSLALQ